MFARWSTQPGSQSKQERRRRNVRLLAPIAVAMVSLLLACTRPAAPPQTGAPPGASVVPSGSPSAVAAGFDEKTVGDFYRGKTVRIVVGFSPGGGYDTYSRLIARYMGKYIPGNPTVIVENTTGAGSMVATNQVYNSLPKDGTVIGNVAGSNVLEQVFKTPGVEYDMGKMHLLSVPAPENYLMVVHNRTGITKLEDVMGPNAKQLTMGGISGSTVEHSPLLMRDATGANIRVVSGYEGTAPVRLAIEGGEVDGFFNSWQSIKITNQDDINNGTWHILAQMNAERMSGLPGNPPTIPEIARTEEQRQLLLFGVSYPNQFGKVYFAAPEVPADRAAALAEAFKKTYADREFLAEAETAKLEINPMAPDQIKKLVTDMLAMPDGVRSKLQDVMKRT